MPHGINTTCSEGPVWRLDQERLRQKEQQLQSKEADIEVHTRSLWPPSCECKST